MGLINDLVELILLPFKILAAVVEVAVGLVNATFATIGALFNAMAAIMTGIVNFTVFIFEASFKIILFPFRVLEAILPPYGGGGGGNSGGSSRKGRAK